MKCYRAGIAVLVLIGIAGCFDESQDPQITTANGLEVRVVTAQYQATANVGTYLTIVAPAAGVDVRVTWRDRNLEGRTDADGRVTFLGIAPQLTSPVDIAIDGSDGRPDFAVFGWPLTQITLPLPQAVPPAPLAAAQATDQIAHIGGILSGWSSSAIGESSEAWMSWRHTNGNVLGVVAEVNDLYARAGLDVGSGRVECVCNDTATQNCIAAGGDALACPCPEEAIVCNDPGGFATGASAVNFFVPPGTIELGFAERITKTSDGRFVESGGIYYEPGFAIPANASYDREVFVPQQRSDPDLCSANGLAGAAQLILQGIGREYVIASRGGVEVSLFLTSPLGLRIDVLRGDRWPQADVTSLATDRQRVAVRYPFALTGVLAGFSYGYDVAATSQSTAAIGGVRYDYTVRRRVPTGIVDPCRIDIDLTTYETVFARPTTLEPLLRDGEQTLQWSGPSSQLRRIWIRDAGGTIVTEAWLLDPNLSILQIGRGAAAHWDWAPGEYDLEYTVIHAEFETLPADVLIRSDVRIFAEAGSFFTQRHRFAVIE